MIHHPAGRFTIAALLLASGYASRSDCSEAVVPSRVPFAICMRFENEPAGDVLRYMETEVGQILKPIGIPIAWRMLNQPGGGIFGGQLVIVSFHGHFEAGSQPSIAVKQAPLGVTQMNRGNVLPFADLHCEQIRGAIRNELAIATPAQRDVLMGRAVGRVLAHELYHILARTQWHSSSGLTRSSLSEVDLTGACQGFQARELLRMRKGLSDALQAKRDQKQESGSPAIGAYLFKSSGCARCHGSKRQGTKSGPPLRGIGAAAAGRVCQGADRRDAARSVLDEADIQDLISFLNPPE